MLTNLRGEVTEISKDFGTGRVVIRPLPHMVQGVVMWDPSKAEANIYDGTRWRKVPNQISQWPPRAEQTAVVGKLFGYTVESHSNVPRGAVALRYDKLNKPCAIMINPSDTVQLSMASHDSVLVQRARTLILEAEMGSSPYGRRPS